MRGTRDRTGGATGFTLIELLVVMAVIILLMAILVPVLNRSAAQARQVQCLGNVKQMGNAIVTYHGNYRGFMPSPAHCDAAVSLNDRWDGDPNYPNTDRGPYTWKGKILNYIGTASDTPEEKYQLFKCPAVRLFKDHKSFYGFNAYIGMHIPERLRDGEGFFKMSHFDDLDLTSKTFLVGENNTGHWAVKPINPREPADFSSATDDAKVHLRHMDRSSWLFADGHSEALAQADNEQQHCFLWVPSKKEHREKYGGQ